jgi:hypothetical protein
MPQQGIFFEQAAGDSPMKIVEIKDKHFAV